VDHRIDDGIYAYLEQFIRRQPEQPVAHEIPVALRGGRAPATMTVRKANRFPICDSLDLAPLVIDFGLQILDCLT
jgi:hypothetical protein